MKTWGSVGVEWPSLQSVWRREWDPRGSAAAEVSPLWELGSLHCEKACLFFGCLVYY